MFDCFFGSSGFKHIEVSRIRAIGLRGKTTRRVDDQPFEAKDRQFEDALSRPRTGMPKDQGNNF